MQSWLRKLALSKCSSISTFMTRERFPSKSSWRPWKRLDSTIVYRRWLLSSTSTTWMEVESLTTKSSRESSLEERTQRARWPRSRPQIHNSKILGIKLVGSTRCWRCSERRLFRGEPEVSSASRECLRSWMTTDLRVWAGMNLRKPAENTRWRSALMTLACFSKPLTPTGTVPSNTTNSSEWLEGISQTIEGS